MENDEFILLLVAIGKHYTVALKFGSVSVFYIC